MMEADGVWGVSLAAILDVGCCSQLDVSGLRKHACQMRSMLRIPIVEIYPKVMTAGVGPDTNDSGLFVVGGEVG